MRARSARMIALVLMLVSLALVTSGCFSSRSVGLPPPPPGLGGGNGSLSITVQRAYAYRTPPWRWLAWLFSTPVRAASSASRYLRVAVLPPDYPPIADKTVEVSGSGPATLQFQARVPVGTGYRVAATEFELAADASWYSSKSAVAFGKVGNITVYPDQAASVTVTTHTLLYTLDYDRQCEWHYNQPCFRGRIAISPGFKVGGLGTVNEPSSEGQAVVGYSALDDRSPTVVDFSGSPSGGAPQQPVTLRFRLALEVYESRSSANADPASFIVPPWVEPPIEVTVLPPGGSIGFQ